MTAPFTPSSAADAAVHAWSKRVRRVGGFIQVAFATFWLVRGSVNIHGPLGAALAVSFATTAMAAVVYGIRATSGRAPRPTSTEGKHLERAITVATVLQLVASFVAPAIVVAVGHSDWLLPSIAVTIGPLLLWLDRRVGVPRYRPAGVALIVGPVAFAIVLSGTALAATTGIAAGALLLGIAIAGFHDLASGDERPDRRNGNRGQDPSVIQVAHSTTPDHPVHSVVVQADPGGS
jgi:hypothetical protein